MIEQVAVELTLKAMQEELTKIQGKLHQMYGENSKDDCLDIMVDEAIVNIEDAIRDLDKAKKVITTINATGEK